MASCVHITQSFLIFGTVNGSIFYYYIGDLYPSFISEYCHPSGGIRRIWPNRLGTRMLFEDDRTVLNFYNPTKEQVHTMSNISGPIEDIRWDAWDPHLFVLTTMTLNYTYVFSSITDGLQKVSCSASNMGNQLCKSVSKDVKVDKKKGKKTFDENLRMLHLDKAWIDAVMLQEATVWKTYISQSIKQLEIQIALKACQEANDIIGILRLYELENVEESLLLIGHTSKIMKNYNDAFNAYTQLSKFEIACTMQCHLQQWNQVMEIINMNAKNMDFIIEKYGLSLELYDNYRLAYASYEKTLNSTNSTYVQQIISQAGLIRLSIHFGDLWKGRQKATLYNQPTLFCECAKALMGLKLYEDVAELYELGSHFEMSTMMYIVSKNLSKALHTLKHIAFSPKLQIQYAKALETNHRYMEASTAYEIAEDYYNVIRIHLEHLKNPLKAYSILRETKIVAGAAMATKYCKNNGNYENAIEFMIMQMRIQEANELAKQHGLMDIYSDLVKDIASRNECNLLAKYYESIEKYDKASVLYEKCGEHKHALRSLLQVGTHEAMENAIEMVGKLRSDTLTSQLLDFFMGETDNKGITTGPQYIFNLQMVLGNYDEATKVASQIVNQEQEMGNYKVAHQQLLQFHNSLISQGHQLPAHLREQLMLLHSYILVKIMIRVDNHRWSARMLIRVAQHINKFPAHVNPILVSTVIQCQCSGLKKSAYDYAIMLLRPEFKCNLSKEHKRMVENIVRKYVKTNEEDPLSPCPFCGVEIPETQLSCPTCHSTIPYCIATGQHMVLGDWSQCPNCKFPALMEPFLTVIDADKVCPMCLQVVDKRDIHKLLDPLSKSIPK